MVPKTDAYHYTKLSKPVTVCHPDAESFITTATSGGSSECSTGINKVHTTYLVHTYTLDTFQDFLIAEHIKPRMHILEISISSLNHVILRPTKTPKSADKKWQFLTFKVNFLRQKLSESF